MVSTCTPLRGLHAMDSRIEEDVMQLLKNIGAVAVLGAVIAACGGNAPTQTPGATQAAGDGGGGGGGGATQAPAATDGGGGGITDASHGKATFTISGPITKSGEFAFVPAGSIFGGDQGDSLSFTDSLQNNTSILSIVQSPDGSVVVSYGGPDGQIPGAPCTTTDWNIGAGSGSGKFDCTAAFTLMPSGATVQGGEIKGEFSAHS
jgi:hypothetical protein